MNTPKGDDPMVATPASLSTITTQTPDTDTEAKTSRRGFASMSPEKKREIASKGGKAAHALGTAHKWTHEEAQAAGRKGGTISRRRARHQD